jgi:hypothetical protein
MAMAIMVVDVWHPSEWMIVKLITDLLSKAGHVGENCRVVIYDTCIRGPRGFRIECGCGGAEWSSDLLRRAKE